MQGNIVHFIFFEKTWIPCLKRKGFECILNGQPYGKEMYVSRNPARRRWCGPRAAELARIMKSKILQFVVAHDPIPPYLGEPNFQLAVDAPKEARKILGKAEEAVGEIPVETHTGMIKGSPRDNYRDGESARMRFDRNGFTRLEPAGRGPAGQ